MKQLLFVHQNALAKKLPLKSHCENQPGFHNSILLFAAWDTFEKYVYIGIWGLPD